ncbi:tetratricopeptide repeat protein [Aureitalea marina]|uniref:Uncharacterized protein n=1 Tax=Aureitalea marina TaxID=930804 RepID=A0A2S7KRH6_9FLAO|nr:hypothetical protein [Aureitalea marina]PQB05234.1 hypothetical protein BST85_10325 [Aureitalea marina]
MRTFSFLLLIVFMIGGTSHFCAQTFTMGKKCRAALEEAETAVADDMPEQALTLFDQFSSKCKTKDAKERAAIGKAQAYNALQLYPSAIAEADKALDVTKGKSLEGHFQKAIALNRSGDIQGSKKELKAVMELTENNENTAQRASNYAVMAAIYERQLKQVDSAEYYLDKARELDPNNVNFVIQEGDMYVGMEDYDKAYRMYDQAADMQPASLEVYVARSEARLIQMRQKYGTDQAQALRKKMTPTENQALCSDLKKAVSLGWNDMNKELFIALVCD